MFFQYNTYSCVFILFATLCENATAKYMTNVSVDVPENLQIPQGMSVWLRWRCRCPTLPAFVSLDWVAIIDYSSSVYAFYQFDTGNVTSTYLWTVPMDMKVGSYRLQASCYYGAALCGAAGSNVIQVIRSNEPIQWTFRVSAAIRAPDGISKRVYTINDRFIGPTLWIPMGAVVHVTVINELVNEDISIHWHGLTQRDSAWMDGVQGVTQMGIPPGGQFVYVLNTINETGTHWYHSHSGLQYGDGLLGSIVIFDALHDPYAGRICSDQVVVFQEWGHRTHFDQSADLMGTTYRYNGYFPTWNSGLINGQGKFNCSIMEPEHWSHLIGSDMYRCVDMAYPIIRVTANCTHRLRLTSVTSGTTLVISIDNHPMTVVALDGIAVQPYTVQRINLYVAQRIDVLVHATCQSRSRFWIRATTFDNIHSKFALPQENVYGILEYVGSTAKTVHSTPWPWTSSTVWLQNNFSLLEPDDVRYTLPPLARPTLFSRTLNLLCDKTQWRCTINNVSMLDASATIPIMLQQFLLHKHIVSDDDSDTFATLPFGQPVRLIINNLGNQSHPMHLHGHRFWILGIGAAGAGSFQEQFALNWHNRPVLRDTIQIEEASWLVLLFIADNPGVWLVHCHIQWHIASGMRMVFYSGINRLLDPPLETKYVVLMSEYMSMWTVAHQATNPISLPAMIAVILAAYFIGGVSLALCRSSVCKQSVRACFWRCCICIRCKTTDKTSVGEESTDFLLAAGNET